MYNSDGRINGRERFSECCIVVHNIWRVFIDLIIDQTVVYY